MASLAGWDGAHTGANITLSNGTFLGVNAIWTSNSSGTTMCTRAPAAGMSSGKWILYFTARTTSTPTGSNDGQGISWGLANGTFDTSTRGGFDAGGNSRIWDSDGNFRYQGSSTYNYGANFLKGGNELYAICINLDASPARAYWRRIMNGGGSPNRNDSGWIDSSGNACDPTNTAQGTDISGFGTPVYFITGGNINASNGTIPSACAYFGGWPPLTDLIAIPSGYSMLDANYPFTMPSGNFYFTSTPTDCARSQNNMRIAAVSGVGGSPRAQLQSFPTGSKTIHAMYWESIDGGQYVTDGFHNFVTSGGASVIVAWNSDGTTSNMGGNVLPNFVSGEATYCAYDEAAKRLWFTKDGSTWYGNGGASPNPATNTNGFDVSALSGVSTSYPGIGLSTDSRPAVTANAGRVIDPFPVPSGFRWLDSGGVLRARVMMA
jgi:hypothetical protein